MRVEALATSIYFESMPYCLSEQVGAGAQGRRCMGGWADCCCQCAKRQSSLPAFCSEPNAAGATCLRLARSQGWCGAACMLSLWGWALFEQCPMQIKRLGIGLT